VKQTLSESQLRFSRLGVTDDVDKQDMTNLEFYVGRGLSWHEISFYLRNQI